MSVHVWIIKKKWKCTVIKLKRLHLKIEYEMNFKFIIKFCILWMTKYYMNHSFVCIWKKLYSVYDWIKWYVPIFWQKIVDLS